MSGRRVTRVVSVALCLVLAAVPAVGAGAGPSASPDGSTAVGPVGTPGARSMGDPFYPTLGNGGYDVLAYDLDLTWHPPDARWPLGQVAGVADIDLRTTQDLSSLSLDLTRANSLVTGVTVDGRAADHAADGFGRKLIITPATSLPADTDVRVRVTWTALPHAVNRLGEDLPLAAPGETEAEGARAVGRGFLSDGNGGFFLASQPNGAHTLYPSNDYPTDKAPFRVRLTAPAGMLGVATGDRVTQTANEDGTTTTTWESGEPVATHVLGMGVGRWSVLEADPADGPHLRSSVPVGVESLAPLRTGVLPDAVEWLEAVLDRPYPFRTLGLQLVAPGSTDAILEGQTLILAGAGMLDPRVADCAWRATAVHETAHQWFGDSVSLKRWDQKWLSEGHATFYQRLWEADSGCDMLGFERRMRAIYERGQAVRDVGGPPDRPRAPRFAYDSTIYDQGALALYALRERVGKRVFGDIERAWLTRYADASASTDDLIALASEVAGKDLTQFLEDWLRGDELPPMPNHPDWGV